MLGYLGTVGLETIVVAEYYLSPSKTRQQAR